MRCVIIGGLARMSHRAGRSPRSGEGAAISARLSGQGMRGRWRMAGIWGIPAE